MKTIVVGMGNPLLGDDGIGWRIADEVVQALLNAPLPHKDVQVDCLALGGLRLMEHLIGYDRAILVDAIDLEGQPPGAVRMFALEELPNPAGGHLTSTHDTSLQNALHVGAALGAHLPAAIQVVTIQSSYVYVFTEELSPCVAAAIPEAVHLVLEALAHPMPVRRTVEEPK